MPLLIRALTITADLPISPAYSWQSSCTLTEYTQSWHIQSKCMLAWRESSICSTTYKDRAARQLKAPGKLTLVQHSE